MTFEENLKVLEMEAALDGKFISYNICMFHKGVEDVEHGELLPVLLVGYTKWDEIIAIRPCEKHFEIYLKNGTSWGPWRVL